MSNWPIALADVLTSGYNIREPGLIGWWPFNETSGATAYDRSGAGVNGTINGASRVTGVSGNALSFDGTDDNVSLGDFPHPTGALSFEVRFQTSTSGRRLFEKYGAAGNRSLLISTGASVANKLDFRLSADGTAMSDFYSNSVVVTGAWVHAIMVFVPSVSVTFYVNGAVDKITTAGVPASIFDSTANMYIGGSASFWLGLADEVRVYNYAMDSTEAYRRYRNPTTYEALPGPDIGGFTESAQDGVIRSQMDTGPAKVRSRFTAAVRTFQQQMVLDRYQKQVLEQFYTSLGGANTFTYTHPDTGESLTARFASRPQFALEGGLYYRAAFGLEVLP